MAAVYRLETRQGQVVIKHDDASRLRGEAEGLRALRSASGQLVVPEVLGLSAGWLVIESLDTVPGGPQSETALGEGLRGLHSVIGDAHGWHQDNACGRTPQPNAPLSDGRAFQRERRLLPCVRRATSVVYWTQRYAGVSSAWLRIWSAGCQMHRPACSTATSGRECALHHKGPAIIDPAVYRHYPEVDVAMLTLFGSPGSVFDAYWNGDAPADWPRREALFQLYPLLNHLLLFGASYRSAVERSVARLESYT